MDRDCVLRLTATIHMPLEPQLMIFLSLVSYFSISFSIFLLLSLLSQGNLRSQNAYRPLFPVTVLPVVVFLVTIPAVKNKSFCCYNQLLNFFFFPVISSKESFSKESSCPESEVGHHKGQLSSLCPLPTFYARQLPHWWHEEQKRP